MTKITYIPGEIANAAIDEHGNRKPVTRTQHIFDDAKGKSQADINKDVDDTLALHQSEINALDSQNYVTVDTFGELPTTGAADTVYRVANYDGTQVVTNKYAEYAWNGTQYKLLDVKEYGIDDEPTAGSDNLVKSGGVDKVLTDNYTNVTQKIGDISQNQDSSLNDIPKDEEEIIIGDTEEDYILKIKKNGSVCKIQGEELNTDMLLINFGELVALNSSNIQENSPNPNITPKESIVIQNNRGENVLEIDDDSISLKAIKESVMISDAKRANTYPGSYMSQAGDTVENQYHYLFEYDVRGFNRLYALIVTGPATSVPFYVGKKNGNVVFYKLKPSANEYVFDGFIDVTNIDYLYINTSAGNYKNLIVKDCSKEISPEYKVKPSFVFCGDSIMQGVNAPVGYNCAKFANDILHYNVINAGIGGTNLGNASGSTAINFIRIVDALISNDWTYIDSVTSEWSTDIQLYTKAEIEKLKVQKLDNTDGLFIAYGYNDWRFLQNLDNPNDEEDETTTLGALRSGVKKLLTVKPSLRMYIVTPPYTADADSVYAGMTLSQFCNALVACANTLSIPCRNQFINCNMNKYDINAVSVDGIHRNILGYKILGEQYAKFIKSF